MKLMEMTFPLLFKISVSAIIILVLSGIGIGAYLQGLKTAQHQKDNFHGCELPQLNSKESCDFLLEDSQIKYSGLIFAKSESQYGLWTGKKTLIVPLGNLIVEVKHGEMQ